MINYLVKKRKITLLFFIMLIMIGVYSFMGLPRQEMPDALVKTALVTTVYPGATPEKVEQAVTKVLEQAIKKVDSVENILSTSGSGYSSITVEAYADADAEAAWDELRKNVQDAAADLPDDAMQPIVNDNLASAFVGSYVIYADTREELYALNDTMIGWRDQIQTVKGVAGVQIDGIPGQEVAVQIDTQKLQQYGIPWEMVVQSVQKMNTRIPLGDLNYDNRNYQLLVKSLDDVKKLNDVLIMTTQDGFPVHLKDVGEAKLAHGDPEYSPYYNGKPAILIKVNAQTGSDVPSMDKAISMKLSDLAQHLPKNVTFKTAFAQLEVVDKMFSELTREMLIAIVAVIIVCMLGLNLLTAAFVALAIPISIALGLIVLPMTGVTLNEITIVGLIIVLGILVDDAVVVNDNIERRLSELGENPTDASVKGAKEVSISILTATLSTIFAFMPLLFLTGDVGSFIKPLPIVISASMLASMAMSLTIIPIFREWHEKRRIHRQAKEGGVKPPGLLGKQIQAATQWYSGKMIPKVLKRPLLTALTGLLIGTASFGFALLTPIDLFPQAEDPNVNINVEMPVGTSFQETDRMVSSIAEWVRKQPEAERVSYGVGGKAPELYSDITNFVSSSPTVGQVAVNGKKGTLDWEKTVATWQKKLEKLYPAANIATSIPRLGIPVGAAVSVRISGEDLGELQSLSQQVKEKIAQVDGTTGIKDNFGNQSYTLEFAVNEEAMKQHQVTYQTLTQTLRLMGDGLDIGDFDTGNQIIDINLYMNNKNGNPNDIFQQMNVTNEQGMQVPLSQLAELKPTFSIQKIQHYNLVRTVTVEANATGGRTATELNTEISALLGGLHFPEGYTWTLGGETSDQAEIFSDLGSLFVIVIFLILLLITVQFYSLSAPIIIMTTVYLAAAGGVIGIFISGSSIGFMSIMGIISLAGIVVRNGIVLIEFIEDARREGVELKEAIIGATSARFRPILLTSLTAIFGLLPLAITGSVLFRPMAYTIIVGLMFSTLLTLIVVPSLYMVVALYKEKRRERKANRDAGQTKPSGHLPEDPNNPLTM
ncbi:Multidrug resistance protein MdtC [Paenibacillus sp. CECT 9249]|uniref:efflux RND transporter permease subunit n=1 Tax=Paenibacillus sp. CECT 9249 TaxID=2845385 RepID=UPI001E30EA9A|nr:efflux RND transporter permease subunit [Paenibacillus sp. CECT 9249]CAH0121238.1 Multidrug resistance protein MdtC [Paenibacillus sp. CECT 9249]